MDEYVITGNALIVDSGPTHRNCDAGLRHQGRHLAAGRSDIAAGQRCVGQGVGPGAVEVHEVQDVLADGLLAKTDKGAVGGPHVLVERNLQTVRALHSGQVHATVRWIWDAQIAPAGAERRGECDAEIAGARAAGHRCNLIGSHRRGAPVAQMKCVREIVDVRHVVAEEGG